MLIFSLFLFAELCCCLKILDTAEWNPPKEEVKPCKFDGDEIPSFPSFDFDTYSYIVTRHNSYYFMPGNEMYIYVNGSNSIRGDKCTKDYICEKCKNITEPLFFLQNTFKELKIEWCFIETHEVNVPIGFEKKHQYDMPETYKTNANLWRYKLLDGDSVFAENEYWEIADTREPGRLAFKSTPITTELHPGRETYIYLVFYDFKKEEEAIKIKCKNKT